MSKSFGCGRARQVRFVANRGLDQAEKGKQPDTWQRQTNRPERAGCGRVQVSISHHRLWPGGVLRACHTWARVTLPKTMAHSHGCFLSRDHLVLPAWFQCKRKTKHADRAFGRGTCAQKGRTDTKLHAPPQTKSTKYIHRYRLHIRESATLTSYAQNRQSVLQGPTRKKMEGHTRV